MVLWPAPARHQSGAAGARCAMTCFVYILRCADGTLYTGWTTDVAARERVHNQGRGAKYTASRRPVRVVWEEAHDTRSLAQRREAQIKRWPRAKKIALVRG